MSRFGIHWGSMGRNECCPRALILPSPSAQYDGVAAFFVKKGRRRRPEWLGITLLIEATLRAHPSGR